MFSLFSPKRMRPETRYVIAPRKESLVSAVKQINLNRELQAYVESTTQEERAAHNITQHEFERAFPFRAKSGRVYR